MDQQNEKSSASFLKNYDRRPGTDNQGIDFETNITALVALRSIALEDTEDMWMGSNVAQFGDFDDIVLYRRTTEGRRLIYMMQLKHQETPANITKSEFENIKGHFSVSKYSKTFNSLQEHILVCKKNGEHEVIQYLRDVDDRLFVLYTNKGVDQCDFLERHYDRTIDFLDTSGSNESRFKFSLNQSGIHENFILFSNQITANNAIHLIERDINLLLGPSFRLSPIESNRVVNEFVEFIRTWAKGANVNNSKKYFTLTKYDVISKLTSILLGPYQYKFSDETFSNCRENPIWNKITQDKNITIVDSDQSVFLNQYIASEVRMYLRGFEESWAEKLYKKTLKLISKNDEDLVMTLLKMNVNRREITILDLYTSLWITNRIPLLLKVDTIKDYEDILKVLNLSNYSLHVIIIKSKTLKLDSKIVPTIKYFITLDDLNEEDSGAILNKLIKLQNRPNHTLQNLTDESMYKFVTCTEVILILQGNFNVGDEYDPLMKFHIERTLSRVIVDPAILNEITDEIFVLKRTDKSTFKEFNFPNNVIMVEISQTLEEEKWRGNVIHEMIIRSDSYLEWKRSLGTTENILKYVIKNKKDGTTADIVANWIKFEDEHAYFLSDTHVITALPGMGKSIFTDFMALHVPANVWIIKIILNKYEEYYENNKNNSAVGHLMFFTDELLHKCKHLELSKAIFQKCLNAKRVLVILDGFDEIVIDYEKQVLNIAQCLHDEGFPLWLTTRSNKKCQLEELFCTIAVTLNPLTVHDQKILFKNYFNQMCMSGHLNEDSFMEKFIDELMKVVRYNFNDGNGEFMEIPLHVKLLAEFFSVDCETSLQTGSIIVNETFHLVDLYERFLKRKIDILCEKFGKDAKRSRIMIEKYQKLFALKYLYPEERLKNLKINEQLDEYYNGEEYKMYFLQREGIVVVEQEGNGEKLYYNINFTHRTFAEFLTAQWVSENFSNPDYKMRQSVRSLINYDSINLVHDMLNFMLAKNCLLHVAVLTGKLEEAKKILVADPTSASQMDGGGRTVLHIIAIKCKSNPEITNIVETITNYSIRDAKDLIRTSTALDYVVYDQEYALANQMCKIFPNLTVTYTSFGKFCTEALLQEWAGKNYKRLFEVGLRFHFSCSLLGCWGGNIGSLGCYLPDAFENCWLLKNYVSEFGMVTISEFLQFKSKDIDSPVGHYYYDLDIACAFGTEENVNYLLSKGAKINSPNFEATPLHYAARHNRLDIVKLLLDKGAETDKPDENGKTALHWASSPDIVNELLSKDADIDKLDITDETPLNVALNKKNVDMARLLLLKGANCNLENRHGWSSLHYAAVNTCPQLITEILSRGVSINKPIKDGSTPLNVALSKGNFDIARLLLRKGADYNLEDHDGSTSLHYAAENNCPDIITELLSKGVCVNKQDKFGNTPLHIALRHRNLTVTRLLLLKGAECNSEDRYGHSPVHYAVRSDSPDLITELLSHGVCVNKQDKSGNTPLYTAIRNGNLDIAKLLLQEGAYCNSESIGGYSSLHYAAHHDCPDIITDLLLQGVCINKQNHDGDTPLHLALSKKKLGNARLLLLKGANCNSENTSGYSPLHYAAQSDCPDIITKLLSQGVCINKQNKDGDTPLHIALCNINLDNARLLLLKGADCTLENCSGNSSLHYAAKINCPDLITKLLSQGVNVNKQNQDGKTPLHIALCSKNPGIAKLLLLKGANCNLENNFGWSSLHYAAQSDCPDIITELLSQDVCVNKQTKNGNTPLHIAVEALRTETAELLLSKGADINLQNNNGESPLHTAVIGGVYISPPNERMSLFSFLLDKGADINVQDKNGNTPLHLTYIPNYGVEFIHEARKLLLGRGADANVKNISGETASK